MGPAISKTTNTLDNSITATISDKMESNVNGNATAHCSNSQLAVGSKRCDIEFARQVCRAEVISNMTADTSLESVITQDVTNQLSQSAESMTEGLSLQLASVSSASNVIQNHVNVGMEVSKVFTTTCTRGLSAVNEQSTYDCEESKIKFAEQDVSGKVVGDCVVSHMGKSTAYQKLMNTVDQEAKATTKGVDLWALLLLMGGGLFLMIFGVPASIYAFRVAANKEVNKKTESAAEKQQAVSMEMRMRAVMVLAGAVALSAIFWWPGLGSYLLNVFPWDHAVSGEVEICKPAGIEEEVYVNKFMWYDPYCATTRAGCSEDEKMKAYKNCGLFAASDGCDDPAFLQQKEKYRNTLKACSVLAGTGIGQCTTMSIADSVMLEELKDAQGRVLGFEGCKRCNGSSEAERASADRWKNFGLWVRASSSCAEPINYGAYLRAGSLCKFDEGEDCHETEASFVKASPHECVHKNYQTLKRKFSRYFRACEKVQEHHVVNRASYGGSTPPLARQCPADPFDFFTQCNKSTKQCSYTGTSRLRDASCKNDFSGCCKVTDNGDGTETISCADSEYQQDVTAYRVANAACRRRQSARARLNPAAAYVTLAVYILAILAMAYIFIRDTRVRSAAVAGARSPAARSVLVYGGFLFCVAGVIGFGIPFGLAALVDAGSKYSVYKEVPKGLEAEKYRPYAYVATAIFAVLLLLLIPQVFRRAWGARSDGGGASEDPTKGDPTKRLSGREIAAGQKRTRAAA